MFHHFIYLNTKKGMPFDIPFFIENLQNVISFSSL